MSFYTEPDGYFKTGFSDLQGAWSNLREIVVRLSPFPKWEKLLFHIDEGMSWESVRNLNSMNNTLLLIGNIANQENAPQEVFECIVIVRNNLDEVFDSEQ